MKNAFLRPFTMKYKCVLSVKESNFNEKKDQNFHIWLRLGPRWLTPPPLRSEGRKISVFFYACPLIVGDKKTVKFRSHWMTMGWWLGRVFDGIIMSWKIYKSKLTLLFQLGWLCLWLLWTLIPCYFTSSKFLTPFKPVQAWEFDAKGHLNFANFA